VTKILVLAASALVALTVSATAFAGGGAYGPPSQPTAEEAAAGTVVIKADKKGLRFVAPKTIVNGEELKVISKTDPRKFGPHTFSLVTQGSQPKTPKARQLCFTPKHICKEIADWHGVKGNGPVKVNPVEAGGDGWDTLGSLTKEGDSWFSGEKAAGTSLSQPVNFDTSGGPTRIYFICAVHSFMQGSINVLPGG
jgi:hypothetical protein